MGHFLFGITSTTISTQSSFVIDSIRRKRNTGGNSLFVQYSQTGSDIYLHEINADGFEGAESKTIDAATEEAGIFYIKSADGKYLRINDANTAAEWADSLDVNSENYTWAYDPESKTLSHGNFSIHFTRQGETVNGVAGPIIRVVDRTERTITSYPQFNIDGTAQMKGSSDLMDDATQNTGIYLFVRESNGEMGAESDNIDANTTTSGTYYVVSTDNKYLKLNNYNAEWSDNYSESDDSYAWTYDPETQTLNNGNYRLYKDDNGDISAVDSTAIDFTEPEFKVNNVKRYRNENGLFTQVRDENNLIYIYELTKSGDFYVAGNEPSSLKKNTPYYIAADGKDGLYLNATTGEWENLGNRRRNDEENLFAWYYNEDNNTLYHKDNVIYYSGNAILFVNNAPRLKLDNSVVYRDDDNLFTTAVSTDKTIYMYKVNNDGSQSLGRDSDLSVGNYYYLNNGNDYFSANNGGEWTSLTEAAPANSDFAWKCVEKNGKKVLYNEKNELYIQKNDNGYQLVTDPIITVNCASKIANRWVPVNDNTSNPSNYEHKSSDFINNGSDGTRRGYFITAKSNATVNVNGTRFEKLWIDDNGSVKNYAPIVINNSKFNMASGYIQNNTVDYVADDNLSGKQVTGSNSEGSGVRDYLNEKTPTKTAGGIIFENGATAIITGDSYIRQNHGDAGGIIVNGLNTDVTIGGSLQYTETNVPYEVVASDGSVSQSDDYYVLGNDGKYYLLNNVPSGVSRVDNKTYKASINSNVDGGHIDQNVGFHYAGAALVENGATLRMVGEHSTMNNNVTWNRGGAVYATEFGTGGDGTGVKKDFANKKIRYHDETNRVNPINRQPHGEGTFIMTDGEIDGNTAFVRGGGINVESNRVFLIGGTISDNYCRSLGGGIYVEGDYADYTYTLVLNRGYVGTNYSVRYWELDDFNAQENDVDDDNGNYGHYNDYSLSQMNDILDRKLGKPDANGNPIAMDPITGMPIIEGESVSIASGSGYPRRTADVRDFPRPHEGNGGGVWLCPIGGTAVFHMNKDNEVIIDDNYASGLNSSDRKKGTDLYLHSGTGHMLVQNSLGDDGTFEKWINEDTGDQIPENGPVYSGPLYLINDTSANTQYGNSTYGQRKRVEVHQGVHIVNNVSRDGGGIAADGTLLFGLPNDVYRHNAELDFYKYWPKENAATRPVRFKMYYLDENNNEVLIPNYSFGLDGSNSSSNDYDYNPESSSSQNDEYITWNSKVTIPVSVEIPGPNNKSKTYPMYKLQYTGEPFTYTISNSATESTITVDNDTIDPSTVEGMKKLYAISENDKKNKTTTELKIVDWKLVIKEYLVDENGVETEVANAEFSKISSRTVYVSNDNSIPIDVIDAGGVGKTIKGYNINFSSAEFIAEVKNSNGPTIEKYINNIMHQDLLTFDETFEYEIMAYVPLDADEIIIYDTLEEPLMFVSSKNGNPQFLTNSNVVNNSFVNEYNNDRKFFIINNDDSDKPRLAIYDSNNHYGDGSGTVSTNDGTAFTNNLPGVNYDSTNNKDKLNPMNRGNVKIGKIKASDLDANGNVKSITESSDGNTLFIKIDNTSGIEAVRGKWVRVIFDAAIKPAYRDLEKLKQIGWLTNDDSKVGSPVYYDQYVSYDGTGWNELEGIQELVGKQFITKVAAQRPYRNAYYVFAADEFGDYYAKGDSNHNSYKNVGWMKLDNDSDPSINTAKNRLGEIENGNTNGFVLLPLNKTINYTHYDAQFVAEAKYYDNDTLVNDVITPVAGAYGAGDWMFVEDINGDFWYSKKFKWFIMENGVYRKVNNHFVLKDDVKPSDVEWHKLSDSTDPNIDFAKQKIYSDATSTKMDIIAYNWPIVDTSQHQSIQPDQGEANQAKMVIDGKNTYNSNIVTIDIKQPEKYVNDKVHEILRHDQEAEGAFDQVFEYEIMVYVPKEATEFVIFDTLRDDLMFVDRHGKTQYRTYTIGTQDNPVTSTNHGNDILNNEFMSQVSGQDSNSGMTLIANDGHSIDPENDGNSHQLQWYETNDHKGDGTGTVSTAGFDINGPIENAGYIRIIDESDIPANGDWSTLPENNSAGNTIFVKFDEATGIDLVREKWVKVTFFAQIKPSRYIDIVNKLQKSSRHTNDKTFAVDYDATANPNPKPVGYNYRTSELTSIKMNAKGYNPVDGAVPATSIKGYYAKNPETGYFTDFVNSQPSGTEGTDWIYAYESAFVYHAESIDDIPADVKSKGTSEYEDVYLKKGWNDTDDNISWEKVTDDGYVKDGINLYRNNDSKEAYLDVQADGSHAGLANKANYAIKIDNKWNSISTNTVTVVPLLRTITVKKMWIVDEDTPIPSANELLEHIHLYWERITNLDDTQSSDHGRTVGEITELYRNNITIVQEKVEDLTGKTRYTWRIEVKDLPQLRPSMKYFIEEDQFDGFNPPRYLNPSDPEATEHAHDTGSIINSMDSDDTELLVTKKWDVGADDYENKNIRVRLLADGEPVWKRDNQFKIVRDENNNKIEDTSYTKDINSAEEWFILFSSLPKYQRDDNGNYITEPATDINGMAIIDEITNQQVQNKIPIVYSIEVLSDPEGYILSEVYRRESNYIESYTYNIQEADDFSIELQEYNSRDARIKGSATLVGYYIYDVITEQIPYGENILERSYIDYNSGVFFSKNDIDINMLADRCDPDLPSTGGTRNACYLEVYKKTESYLSYEVDLVNTKPQIEKYINKDVHYETFIGNEFTYDIIVHVPEEATEIEIVDELLPTLVLKSIEEPEISGPQSKEITGYNSISISDLPSEISLAVHGNNDHTIYGTVDSDTVFGNVRGTVNTYGNGFKVKIINIVPYGANYVADENGEYLYVKDHLGNKYYKKADELSYYREVSYDSSYTDYRADTVLVRQHDALTDTYMYLTYNRYLSNHSNYPERFTMDPADKFYVVDHYKAANNNHYREVNKKHYVENPEGDFIKLVHNSDSNKIMFVGKDTDLTDEAFKDYARYGNSYYSYEESFDQSIGGKYVQVTFKAGFNLAKQDELKAWSDQGISKIRDNPDLDWDVITKYSATADGDNKGWDNHIKDVLVANGYSGNADYIFDPVNEVVDYLGIENLEVIETNDYYAARKDGKIYICPKNPTTYPDTKDVWLRVETGPTYYSMYAVDNSNPILAQETGNNNFERWKINQNINNSTKIVDSSYSFNIPVEPDRFVEINNKFYIKEVADKYAPDDDYDQGKIIIYRKVDWGRGDGDVIRNDSSPYGTGNHAGVVNTASYEVTYGNGYKSNHKSNTVTVVPEIYELPSSGGIGTFLFNILGVMFITIALSEIVLNKRKKKII